VGPLLDGKLAAAVSTEDDDITTVLTLFSAALTANDQLTLLASSLHAGKRLMRFNCVLDSLSEFIPELEGLISTGSNELISVDRHDASHVVSVSHGRFEITLANNNILIHVGLHLFSGT